MFDKFFCKKFHAKEITFGMLEDKLVSSALFKEFYVISMLIAVPTACLLWFEEGLTANIIVWFSAVIFAVSVVTLKDRFVRHKVVAVCPLSKQ